MASSSETNINNVLLDYELVKEQRRLERVSLEKGVLEDQQQQAVVATQAASNKKLMMLFLAEEHNRFNNEICSVQRKKTLERDHLIQSLHTVEENAASLVEKFARTNEQARRTERLMDQMEKERLEREQWHVVRKEEVANLRKKDIAESFSKMLSNYDVMDELIRKYVLQKRESVCHSIADMSEKGVMLDEKFNNIKDHKHLLIGKLLNEERVQKKAFEMLQYERDSCHARVASQIRLVEDQLCQLTCLELDKKDLQLDNQMNMLEGNRVALTRLLRQLLGERQKREEELRKRLLEMEERSNTHQLNYWLVQYQRLLDSKPQHLFDETSRLEERVVEALERAGAGEYKPMFAHRRVSIESLMACDDDDLKQIGVSNATIRAQILNVIESMRSYKLKEEYVQPPTQLEPSAPQTLKQGITSHSQLNSECVICLSETSDILFLNCGHICTCQACSQALTHCPMDRILIEQKIKIYVTA